MSPPNPWEDDREVGEQIKGTVAKALVKLTHAYNSTQSAVTRYSPHFLMFG